MKILLPGKLFMVFGLLSLFLFAAACSPAAPISATQPAVQATQVGVPVTGNQTVNVAETEYKLDMPNTVKAGTITFNVSNKGTVAHSLEIQGQGFDQQLSSQLQPGQSGSLQVTLKPGSYIVFCPVDGHKGLGMDVNLTVQ